YQDRERSAALPGRTPRPWPFPPPAVPGRSRRAAGGNRKGGRPGRPLRLVSFVVVHRGRWLAPVQRPPTVVGRGAGRRRSTAPTRVAAVRARPVGRRQWPGAGGGVAARERAAGQPRRGGPADRGPPAGIGFKRRPTAAGTPSHSSCKRSPRRCLR